MMFLTENVLRRGLLCPSAERWWLKKGHSVHFKYGPRTCYQFLRLKGRLPGHSTAQNFGGSPFCPGQSHPTSEQAGALHTRREWRV